MRQQQRGERRRIQRARRLSGQMRTIQLTVDDEREYAEASARGIFDVVEEEIKCRSCGYVVCPEWCEANEGSGGVPDMPQDDDEDGLEGWDLFTELPAPSFKDDDK